MTTPRYSHMIVATTEQLEQLPLVIMIPLEDGSAVYLELGVMHDENVYVTRLAGSWKSMDDVAVLRPAVLGEEPEEDL